jgi:hypothetical protein
MISSPVSCQPTTSQLTMAGNPQQRNCQLLRAPDMGDTRIYAYDTFTAKSTDSPQ